MNVVQSVSGGFKDLMVDLKELLYIGDNLTTSLQHARQAFQATRKTFENLKRR